MTYHTAPYQTAVFFSHLPMRTNTIVANLPDLNERKN